MRARAIGGCPRLGDSINSIESAPLGPSVTRSCVERTFRRFQWREPGFEYGRPHPQRLELRLHPALEFGRGAPPPRAEFAPGSRQPIECVAKPRFGLGTRVGDSLQLGDLDARALQGFDHVRERAAILALEPSQLGHPGFDLFEPRRVGLDPCGVVAERVRRLFQAEARGAD